MEICVLLEDVHSRHLEMIVFVRYVIYSERQLRTSFRVKFIFRKAEISAVLWAQ